MCLKYCKSFKIKLDNKDIIVRRPKLTDLESLLQFINSIVEEDPMISINRKLTLKEEKEFLKKSLENIKKNESHILVATYRKDIVGEVSLHKRKFRQSHVATYGISIKKCYRNMGLGTTLSNIAIDIAKKDPDIKILELDVFANNEGAIRFYKRLGFKKVARLPKRVFFKGRYIDKFIMDYPLNKI